jgi:Holliday junction resolvase RusA-like endonuclease
MKLLFTYLGHVKPYVRMTKNGKWVDPQAQQYIANQTEIKYSLKGQMTGEIFDKVPICISGAIFSKSRKGDLDNIVKAVLDAMQGIVFTNDLWIDRIVFTRKFEKFDAFAVNVEKLEIK